MNESEPSPPRVCIPLREVAAILSVSERTLRREIQRGRFPEPVKIANRCMISRIDLEWYLEAKGMKLDV